MKKKKKYNNGGKMKVDSTRVAKVKPLNVKLPTTLPTVKYGSTGSGSSKSKSADKLYEKQHGGSFMENIVPIASAINPMLGMGLELSQSKLNQPIDVNPVEQNTNQFGFKYGGQMNGFKQFDAPSHAQGGQMINSEGVPSAVNPQAEIEKKENMMTYFNLPDKAGQKYIFSEENGTADKLKKAMKKYISDNHKPDLNDITRNAIEFDAKEIEGENEKINEQKNVQEFKKGGEYTLGGNPYFDVAKAANKSIEAMNTLNSGTTFTNPTGNRSDFSGVSTPDTGASQAGLVDSNTEPYNPESQQMGLPKVNSEDLLTALGYGMKTMETFRKPDIDKLIMPDYTSSDARFDKMSADLTQARQGVLGQSNRASELNRGAASSYSQFRNRELSNIGNTADALANVGQQEQQMRNNILGVQGQYELNKAMTDRNIEDDVQVRNLQNQAQSRNIKRQFAADLISQADTIAANKNMKNIANASLEESKMILNTMFPDFNVSDEDVKLIQQLSRGEITQEEFETKASKELIKYAG